MTVLVNAGPPVPALKELLEAHGGFGFIETIPNTADTYVEVQIIGGWGASRTILARMVDDLYLGRDARHEGPLVRQLCGQLGFTHDAGMRPPTLRWTPPRYAAEIVVASPDEVLCKELIKAADDLWVPRLVTVQPGLADPIIRFHLAAGGLAEVSGASECEQALIRMNGNPGDVALVGIAP